MEHIAAMDLGGTWIRAAVVDSEGRLGPMSRRPAERKRPREGILADIMSTIEDAADKAGAGLAELAGLAIGVPTVLDRQGRLTASDNLPTLTGFALGEALKDTLAMPVSVFNDAACFAVGEWRQGAGQGAQNLCGITLGTGIGVGLIIDGRPYFGGRGFAGEIWQSPFDDGKVEDCTCGRSIERAYEAASGRQLDGAEIARLAADGQEEAVAAFAAFGKSLGRVVSFIVNLIDPDAVIFGGSVAESFDLFRDALMQVLDEAVVESGGLRINVSRLGESAALLGAAELFWIMQKGVCNGPA